MFLQNCWYVAAESREVSRAPMGRVLLGEPVVLYRREDGTPIALEDRCCHRRAPLHKGRLIGDRLQCGYHGFTFDTSGACVAIPGQDRVPASLGVRAYPVAERHRYVWIWMGKKEKADPALIPDFYYNDDPSWAAVGACLHVEANYLLLVENLIDLSHVPFVHAATIGSTEDTNPTLKYERGDDFVRVVRDAPGISCPPSMRSLGFAPVVDQSKIITFTPASNIWIDIPTRDAAPVAGRNEPMQRRVVILNAITPETDASCHYFWVNARDFDQDNAERSAFFLKTVTLAFNEDKDMLEAQQRNIALDPVASTVNVHADWGGVQAMRMMEQMIAAETRA
ncbi:MAG TPA: aromatic ring-hydroxylating dioxygenase subunit alpha [Stellaceae bacterium]|nr:aromatic ring-hydroxylating dioxygenase subunit alpha [Stellaceae bacterium]